MVEVEIPRDYSADHMILMLKMRQGKVDYVGPNLTIYMKITKLSSKGRMIKSDKDDDFSESGLEE